MALDLSKNVLLMQDETLDLWLLSAGAGLSKTKTAVAKVQDKNVTNLELHLCSSNSCSMWSAEGQDAENTPQFQGMLKITEQHSPRFTMRWRQTRSC